MFMHLSRTWKFPKPLFRGLSARSHLGAIRAKDAPLDIHPEVEDALSNGKPVVALETALVTHGLPYPSSLEVPLSLEAMVRSTGAIPATIGIIEGRVKVGLERYELERLAERKGKPSKISRRDIAAAIATEADGGTTCSATLIFSALAGIKVFATGGLGGVHRGGESSLDISADLHELTRCPVGLVSAGVKSILDIKRTLEYLETLGVPVIPYGDSREFPAFFSRHSGHKLPWNVDDSPTAAKILYTQWQLGIQNGALFAVPIPEEYEPMGEQIQQYVNQAVLESEQNGINKSGNDATPWLLNRIAELSGGNSLTSNIALLKNTALVGGKIAVEYQKLVNEGFHDSGNKQPMVKPSFSKAKQYSPSFPDHKEQEPSHKALADVAVIGAAALDITSQEFPNVNPSLGVHSTAPGSIGISPGGVARNIAEATHRVMAAKFPGLSSILVAPVGYDAFGQILVDNLHAFGMRTDGIIRTNTHSAVCNMVLDSNGALVRGVADMGINESVNSEEIIQHLQKHAPTIVALDGNLSPRTINALVQHCRDHAINVLFEPTSVIKSTSILPAVVTALEQGASKHAPIAYCTPNLLELNQLFETAQSDIFELTNHPSWWYAIESLNLGSAFRMDLEQLARRPLSDYGGTKGNLSFLIEDGVVQKAVHLLPFFQHLIIKCGDRGVLVVMSISPEDASRSDWSKKHSNPHQRCIVAHGNSNETVVLQYIPSLQVDTLVNVTGAGDSFVGAFLAMLAHQPNVLYHQESLHEAILTSQKAAVLTLQSHSAVSPLLSSIP